MKKQTLNVSRPSQSSIGVNGDIVLGEPTLLTVRTTVQPADRIQMDAQPQLRDYKQAFILYPNTELFTADAEAKTEADKVSIYGKDYEVVTSEPWQNGLRSHYKIIVGR
jgi:hypothetical protein